jgi:hypothetical protein
MNAPGMLVRYDAMVHAISECHRIDEVKDLHDKARALEIYARQAMNVDAEYKARQIRIRAERKAGELMKAMQRAPTSGGGDTRSKTGRQSLPSGPSKYRAALETAGINERTARRWQELADVPKNDFETALRDSEKKPSTTGILAASKPASNRMDSDALWIWGVIKDHERQNYSKRKPRELFEAMHETMREDIPRLLPKMIEWLIELQEISK